MFANTKFPTYFHVRADDYINKFHVRTELYPVISGLCRDLDKKYQGIGAMIINAMCEYFEEMYTNLNNGSGSDYIYLIVGAGKHKITTNTNDPEKNDYLTANHKLINYYTKMDSR